MGLTWGPVEGGFSAHRHKPVLLWFDVASSPQDRDLRVASARFFCATYATDLQRVREVIEETQPAVLCFEFDRVDPVGLEGLYTALTGYPRIPILVLTTEHSEQLAVWVFRAGAWNYLVKPVSVAEFAANLTTLAQMVSRGCLPARPMPPEIHAHPDIPFSRIDARVERLQPALHYVRESFRGKVCEREAASRCSLQRFTFSRQFHAAFGLTFREYVMRSRIGEARRMLVEGGHSVTDVVYATGFTDGSYFARMFKRHTGVLPSDYPPRTGP